MQSIQKLQLYCVLQFCLQFYKPCTISNPSVINYFLLLWFIIGFLKMQFIQIKFAFTILLHTILVSKQWARKLKIKFRPNFFQDIFNLQIFSKRKNNWQNQNFWNSLHILFHKCFFFLSLYVLFEIIWHTMWNDINF